MVKDRDVESRGVITWAMVGSVGEEGIVFMKAEVGSLRRAQCVMVVSSDSRRWRVDRQATVRESVKCYRQCISCNGKEGVRRTCPRESSSTRREKTQKSIHNTAHTIGRMTIYELRGRREFGRRAERTNRDWFDLGNMEDWMNSEMNRTCQFHSVGTDGRVDDERAEEAR
ncbi:hypothetical protein CRENBAI_014083 [Crenichthys baileyi]|uniref:Uncharacterized protein n=1 Tax=Crenichthys baileyi TaxID=28760 RepID=A0AAV9RRN7_9TELE